MSEYEGLTDEQVAYERAFLEGVPIINLGALFLPPIWGPGHGMWLTILWYPLWLLADNIFYAAYADPQVLSVVLAVVVFICLTAVTFLFARFAQVRALHRAVDEQGKTKEQYLRTERSWTVGCVAAGIVLLVLATWYNVSIRGGM